VEIEEYVKATEEAYENEWEYWEKLEGDTPLGGPMRISFKNKKES